MLKEKEERLEAKLAKMGGKTPKSTASQQQRENKLLEREAAYQTEKNEQAARNL